MSKKFMIIIIVCLLIFTSISVIYAYEYAASDSYHLSDENLAGNTNGITSHNYNFIVEEINSDDESGKVIHKYTQIDSIE